MFCLLPLTFFCNCKCVFKWIMRCAVNTGTKTQMPDPVRRIKLSRRERLNVMHMHMVNTETFSWGNVKTSTNAVHYKRPIYLTTLRESVFHFFTEMFIFTLSNIFGIFRECPSAFSICFADILACIATSVRFIL